MSTPDREPPRLPQASPEELPFPTPAQLDLLRAALLPGPGAAAAWASWKGRGIELERVDEASGRLFSQLWANREAAGIGDEDLPLLKGVYRQALAHNAVVVDAGLRAVQPLTDAGVPVVLTKGVAMLAVGDRGLGLRRTEDFDVLVPERDADRAIRILLDHGRTPKYPRLPPIGTHAWTSVDTDGDHDLDLHWWAHKYAGDDRCVFETARAATLLGRPVLVPSPTEMLISAVAHAFTRSPAAPVRWIGDAWLLLEVAGPEIAWDLLLERAVSRPGLHLALRDGLSYLRDTLGADIPSGIVDELRRRRAPLRSRWAHRVALTDPRVGAVWFSALEQHRARRLHDRSSTPIDVVGHLAQTTGVGTRRALVARHGKRLVVRLVSSEPLLRVKRKPALPG